MAKAANPKSGKGTVAGKSAGGKGDPGASARAASKVSRGAGALERLRAELDELASELDGEGLEFLIEQARVLRYNMQVETLERLGDELEATRVRAGAKGAPAKGGAAKAAAAPRFVAGEDGKTFHLVWKGEYKLFGADEVSAMLKAARGGPARLWAWLEKERADAIGDLALSGPSDPDLARLASTLESTFVIRKP